MAKKSPLVEREKKLREDHVGFVLSGEQQEQLGRIVQRISDARSLRETPRDEFDGLSYENAYLSNKRAAMSYLQPKNNDSEVRINTGTTEKRIELVWSELLGMNLEEEIETFDKNDNLLLEASEMFTDVVKRTEQIELARDKDIFIYQELLTQPSAFVEELWIKENIRNSTKKGFRVRHRCDRRPLQGVQMYLGDIFLPDYRFNEQPYLVKYARLNQSEAETLFKDLNTEAWKATKPGAYSTIGSINTELYRKNSLRVNEYEAFWYMSYPDNELQIVVNGIPFLPVGAKYTDEFGELGGYHITMVSLKPYSSDFAYGKPLTQSAKTLQALDNEMIRNIIRKWRQTIEPPIGTPSGKMFSRDIWNAGRITQGIGKKDFEFLVDHKGLTRSEIAVFDLIEKKTNEFVGAVQQAPLEGSAQRTATEHMLAQKAAVKLLGLAVLACMRLKERLALLRVRNVLANYTKPVGKEVDPITNKLKDVYARFSIEDADIDGETGERVIQFADRSLDQEETQMLFEAEQDLKKKGRNIEYKVVNVNKLRDLDLYFYANVSSKPRESTELEKAMIMEKIQQGQAISQITGRPMNANKLIQGFERAWRDKGIFEKEAPQSLGQFNQQMAEGQIPKTPGTEVGGNMRKMSGEGMTGQIPNV
jgi:hypothetical protein